MRPELKEYNLDWLFAATFNVSKNLCNATANELKGMFKYIPYVRPLLEPLLATGKPAMTFLDFFGDYYTDIVRARENNKKVVMTTFCFDPSVFHISIRIEPERTSGSDAGSAFYLRDICLCPDS